MPLRLWSRWLVLARKAAEVQGQVVFFLLYYVVLVPLAVLKSPRTVFRGPRPSAPEWRPRSTSPDPMESARQQF